MFKPTISSRPLRILDFDLETVAAGFADPNWVPQRVTCIAWSWIGEDKVHSALRIEGVERMFKEFLRSYEQADMVTGHNLIRFDLPVLNADLLRRDYEPLGKILVQDTIGLVRTKGFKKGQENLAELLRIPAKKQSMDWQAWDDAYEWDNLIEGSKVTWDLIRRRCESDVIQHKLLREQMLERGWLKPAKEWKP